MRVNLSDAKCSSGAGAAGKGGATSASTLILLQFEGRTRYLPVGLD
jgi:hypothetical protein